jgi:hypothetical protein
MVHQQDKSKEMNKGEEVHWISPPLPFLIYNLSFFIYNY